MQTAPHPASLSTPQHQGDTARFFRRLGGTLRSVIAGGIALTGGMRRPAAPKPSRNPLAPRDTPAGNPPASPDIAPCNPPAPRDTAPGNLPVPSPSRPRAPRRPRPAAPVPPPQAARPGWFARWFSPSRRHPASPDWPAPADFGRTPFTPEAYPGLSAEDCAFLNTPVEECDPDLLRLILSVLVEHIVDCLPPELGMDAKALFSTLCGRLGTVPDAAAPDVSPAEQPAAAPDVPENAAPATAPDPAVAPAAAPATPPGAPPAPQIQPQGTEPAGDAAPAIVITWGTTADTAGLPRNVFSRRARFDISRPFRHRRRWLVPNRRSCAHRRLVADMQRLPPRRLCYAACAGPP